MDDFSGIPGEVVDDIELKLKQRTRAPEAAERIQCLEERPCFSLHSGRYRAATWLDRSHQVLWLLCIGIHRDDSTEDFYNVARRLEDSGALYPTEEDYALLAETEVVERQQREADALAALREEATRSPERGRRVLQSPDGLYAEIWAEAIPELMLVALRVRLLRFGREPLTPDNLAIIVDTVLGPDAVEGPDPDNHWAFRYFESYFPVPADPA